MAINTKQTKKKRGFIERFKDALSVLIDRQAQYYTNRIYPLNMQEGVAFKVCENFVTYVSEGYAGNPIVYGAIRLKANIAAELEWKLYTKKPDGTRDEYEGEHRLKQILERPNERMPWHQWLENYITFVDLAGIAPIHGAKPNNELNFLRPDALDVVPGPRRTVKEYVYTPDPAQDPDHYKPEDVCLITLTNPLNEFDGVSPAEAAARAIDLNNLARLWNTEKIKNTIGLGGMILTNEQPYTENQIESVKEQLYSQYQGPTNVGKWGFAEGHTLVPLSESTKDMDWLNVMDESAKDIIRAFQIPAELMSDAATYENRDYAKREFFTNVIFPMCDALKDALNHWLVPQYGENLEIDFDKENLSSMREDVELLTQRVVSLVENRIITINEGREMLNLDTRDDAELWEEPSSALFQEATGKPPEKEEPLAEPEVTAKPVAAPEEEEVETEQLIRAIGELRTKIIRQDK